MNDTKMTGEVASRSSGPRISAKGVVLTAIAGVGVAVAVLFATGTFDDESSSSSTGATTAVTTTSAVDAAAEHEAAIHEIELRSIELKQVFQEQPAAAVVASPATIEGKLQQMDAAANEAFCQSCFDEFMAKQQADARADERMADKLAQMDAYDAAFGLR